MEGLDISIAIRIGPDSKSYGPVVPVEILSELGIQMVDENSIDLISE
jgi:hypothetical protein